MKIMMTLIGKNDVEEKLLTARTHEQNMYAVLLLNNQSESDTANDLVHHCQLLQAPRSIFRFCYAFSVFALFL